MHVRHQAPYQEEDQRQTTHRHLDLISIIKESIINNHLEHGMHITYYAPVKRWRASGNATQRNLLILKDNIIYNHLKNSMQITSHARVQRWRRDIGYYGAIYMYSKDNIINNHSEHGMQTKRHLLYPAEDGHQVMRTIHSN